MSFDLDAYLARIKLPARPTLDDLGLAAVQRAHRLHIPFENLDIRLGRGIRIDSESVFAKLVTAKRGGYCFEQNRLFLDALTELGFTARPLLARVWLGASETPGLTHMTLLVTIDGQDWIADAGFGGSYCPPIMLSEGAEVTGPDGAMHRLIADDRGWVLQRNGHPGATDGRGAGEAWVDQYSFTLAPVSQADMTMSNHWTATAPGTRFTDLVVVSIVLPTGFASLTDRAYRRFAGGEETSADIDDPRVYRLRLSMMFGIDLSADEVAALGLF
ncbi:arylamine N-acetyltransferase [Sphingomonas panacisoli]|uniref:Arylamine N-acetyltransferase n=1 Tax=Sphingomonas panacisoli TaxID=1813879 RepID=A0A5B8LNZ0_9SPHN|nr:arylamine N-acetyltransferase [Sphingomonas panacisoli]QDZ08820.1 arylamine N-acetyltransferase [Sphingomonas panacisoli]